MGELQKEILEMNRTCVYFKYRKFNSKELKKMEEQLDKRILESFENMFDIEKPKKQN